MTRQLDGTDGEWRYRGRTDSEQADGQPIAAPSDIVTQKDEGFQRFYKAVVSPTHVRVTAGGRIVPNTRGSVSPGPKSSIERAPGDAIPNEQAARSIGAVHTDGFPIPPTVFSPMAPIFPGYGTTVLPHMAPGPPPYPMMPWHPAMPLGSGFPGMPGSGSYSQPNEFSSSSRDPDEAGQKSDRGPSRAAPTPGPFPEGAAYHPAIPWVMPPNQPFYSMPYHPSAAYGLQPPVMMNSAVELNSQPRHVASQGSHSSIRSAPLSYGPRSVAIAQSPMSSIRPSEITKNQIGVLRTSLKYLEDQLLYNRHQVDEKALQHQTNLVKKQLRHFEANLESQLTFESNHYPQLSNSKGQAISSVSSRGRPASKASFASEGSLDHHPYKLSNASNTSLAHSIRSRGGTEKKTSFSTGINSTKSVSAFSKVSARSVDTEGGQMSYRGASATLPATAALAPPFEPQRREQLRSTTLDNRSGPNRMSDHESNVSCVEPIRELESGVQNGVKKTSINTDKPLPYLVGYLPAGVKPGRARDTDYAYTRALTEDELRARHMYWGKTPRHLQKGLPKFDGKDFYPPSPIKGRSMNNESSSSYDSGRLALSDASLGDASKPQLEADLFRSLEHAAPKSARGPLGIPTRSESFARSSRATDDTTGSVAGYQRAGSCVTRVGYQTSSGADNAHEGTSTPSLPDKSSSDEAEDDKDLLFKGRREARQVS